MVASYFQLCIFKISLSNCIFKEIHGREQIVSYSTLTYPGAANKFVEIVLLVLGEKLWLNHTLSNILRGSTRSDEMH